MNEKLLCLGGTRSTSQGSPIRPHLHLEVHRVKYCQFAAAMSLVVVHSDVKTASATRTILRTIAVTGLSGKADAACKRLSLCLNRLAPSERARIKIASR